MKFRDVLNCVGGQLRFDLAESDYREEFIDGLYNGLIDNGDYIDLLPEEEQEDEDKVEELERDIRKAVEKVTDEVVKMLNRKFNQ